MVRAAIRSRNMKWRRYSRTRHSKTLLDYCTDEAARLITTAANQTGTWNAGSDQMSVTGHAYTDSMGPVRFFADTTLAAGLDGTGYYFVTRIDANTIQARTTRKPSDAVNVTSTGTGTQRVQKWQNQRAIFESLRANTAQEISAESDIDSLN